MTNYARGAERERQLVARLRAEGWEATRTAGSHGPADVWAGKNGTFRFLQVKAGKTRWPSRRDRAALSVMASNAGAVAEIVRWEPYQEPEFILEPDWP